MSSSLFIVRRLLFSRGRPLLGASMGIALSLIPLVVVDHVAAGMIEGIIARYRETSTYHFQIRRWGAAEPHEWRSLIRIVEANPLTASVWIERRGFALARSSGAGTGLTLRALPGDAPLRDAEFARYIEFDEGFWRLGDNDILLGRDAARRLGTGVGDVLPVLTAKRISGGRYSPKVSRLTVQGIFSSGYEELDRTWAFISLDLGERILSPESSRTFAGGKLIHPSGDARGWEILESSIPPHWETYHWRELNRFLLDNLESTRTVLLIVMALIILVAVFNVMSSLVMLTLERRREIGILKCTGTSPGTITRVFVIAGALAGALGTFFGLGGGLIIAYFVNGVIAGIETVLGFITALFTDAPAPSLLNESYYLQRIPIRIRWISTGLIGASTLLLSALVSWIPASRAASLRPLDVLRRH